MAIARAMADFKQKDFRERFKRFKQKRLTAKNGHVSVEETKDEGEEEEEEEENEADIDMDRGIEAAVEGEENREDEVDEGETNEEEEEDNEGADNKSVEMEGDSDESNGHAGSLAKKLPPSTLGGLNCDKFGGPEEEFAQDMVYWSDIPSDAEYVSPLHVRRGQHKKYLTFEPGKTMYNSRGSTSVSVGLVGLGQVRLVLFETGTDKILEPNNS